VTLQQLFYHANCFNESKHPSILGNKMNVVRETTSQGGEIILTCSDGRCAYGTVIEIYRAMVWLYPDYFSVGICEF